jgi:DNA-binding beta-propeller fold protein YncE
MDAMHAKRAGLMTSAALAFLSAGCAPTAVEMKEIVWPAPPEKARIKFLRVLRGQDDIEKQSGVMAALGGKKRPIRLIKPYGVCVDSRGRVFVSDTVLGRVLMWDFDGSEFKVIGNVAGPGGLIKALNVAVDEKGSTYVSDARRRCVNVYDKDQNFILAIGSQQVLARPTGIAADSQRDRLYVVDTGSHDLEVFSLTGKHLQTIGKRGIGDVEFNFPTNVCVDSAGKIYVADSFNFRIQVLTPGGKLVRKFGSIGTAFGKFSKLKGVGVDSEGNTYATDASFCNVQMFDQLGRLLLFFGKAGMRPGQFRIPAGVFVDYRDRVYVVDQLNSRVQVFQYLGKKYEEEQKRKRAEKGQE